MLGFAVGIASYVAPLYLSEMSEKEDMRKTYFNVSNDGNNRYSCCIYF